MGYEVIHRRNKSSNNLYVHRLIWEAAHGPIPDGILIHHINGIPNDNRLENLMAVTPQEHVRLHHGWVMDDARNWVGRLCKTCHRTLGLDCFSPRSQGYLDPLCRECRAAWAREYRKRRTSAGNPCRSPKKPFKTTCQRCGAEYQATDKRSHFCSQSCRSATTWERWREKHGREITPQGLSSRRTEQKLRKCIESGYREGDLP